MYKIEPARELTRVESYDFYYFENHIFIENSLNQVNLEPQLKAGNLVFLESKSSSFSLTRDLLGLVTRNPEKLSLVRTRTNLTLSLGTISTWAYLVEKVEELETINSAIYVETVLFANNILITSHEIDLTDL